MLFSIRWLGLNLHVNRDKNNVHVIVTTVIRNSKSKGLEMQVQLVCVHINVLPENSWHTQKRIFLRILMEGLFRTNNVGW